MRDSTAPAATAFILVTAVLDIVALGIVLPVAPRLIESFSASAAQAAWLNGVFLALWALVQFFASPLLGALSDRFGRRPVILLSTAGLAADYVLMALAPNLGWLVLGRLLGGLTSASIGAVYAYMADITPAAQRARAFGFIGAAFAAGFILGPALGGLAGEWGPRAPFWLAAGLSGVAFFYGLLVLPESLPPQRRTPFSWKRANPLGAFELLRSQPQLPRLALLNFAMNFCHYVFHAVFVLYAVHRYGFDTLQTGLLLTLAAALNVAVQAVLVGRVAARLGDGRTMLLGLFAGVAGLAAMGLAPSGAAFVAALFLVALWALSLPTLQALMSRCVSEAEQGQLQGANLSVAAVAGVLGPLLFGAVYAWAAAGAGPAPWPGAPFLLAGGLLLAMAGVGWRAARASNGARGQNETER